MLRKNLFIITTIILIASTLSIASSQYSIHISDEIRQIASDDVAVNAQNEAYDLSRIVVNKIGAVTTNLQVLSSAPSVQSGNTQDMAQLFDAAQYSTDDLTEYYMWLDSEGRIISASNIARASYQYNSMWQSEKPPFLTEPHKTATVYYSRIIKSPADNIERLYIAYPIIYSLHEDESQLGNFRGVIVASIRLDTMGAMMRNELSPSFASDVTLVDVAGNVVYSRDASVIGKNIFENPAYVTSPTVTSLSEDDQVRITGFLKASNSGQQAELVNVSVDAKTFTIATQPIIHDGNHFWTIYITAPHVFTNNVDALLAEQDTFMIMTLFVIGSVSVGIAYLMLSWNKRLENTVKARTLELRESNAALTESNRQLALANAQLELHGKLQSEFINIAAHELRTPMMPILGAADLIESKFRQSENGEIVLKRDDFEVISRNANRLEKLANDILDVTRIETQSLRLTKEQFDLYDLVELTVNDIKNHFPNDKITYILELEKGTEVFADKSKIGKVLSNLLSNAAKFTDKGTITVTGKVEINETGKQEIAHISIADTGVGIDSELMPRLFTRFTTRPGMDRPQVGAGLGLYISKGIMEAHEGRIWAENNPRGGAIFHLTLPMDSRNSLFTTSV